MTGELWTSFPRGGVPFMNSRALLWGIILAMGTLLSLHIDDATIQGWFEWLVAQDGWSMADVARLACTCTLARAWALGRVAGATTTAVILQLCANLPYTEQCEITDRLAGPPGLDGSRWFHFSTAGPLVWRNVKSTAVWNHTSRTRIDVARRWSSSLINHIVGVQPLLWAFPLTDPGTQIPTPGAALFRTFDTAVRWALRTRTVPLELQEADAAVRAAKRIRSDV